MPITKTLTPIAPGYSMRSSRGIGAVHITPANGRLKKEMNISMG